MIFHHYDCPSDELQSEDVLFVSSSRAINTRDTGRLTAFLIPWQATCTVIDVSGLPLVFTTF
jgi:hypothetical protein